MLQQTNLADSFTVRGTSLTANRMVYGAMQLAGPQVFGPPRDVVHSDRCFARSGRVRRQPLFTIVRGERSEPTAMLPEDRLIFRASSAFSCPFKRGVDKRASP